MKYLFVVNPKAGKKNPMDTVFPEMAKTCSELGIQYDYAVTEYPGHATEIVKKASAENESVKVFSCGGDGTLCEVANGAVGCDNVEIGCIPCGSGNDYIKSYGEKPFYDLKRNISGESIEVDAVKCGDKYSLNICSMGLDAEVANRMSKIKNLPLITGKMAYNLALVRTFLGNLDNEFAIKIDDKEEVRGKYFFAIAACGEYYGGGYKGGSGAVTNDGLLDFIMIKKVPRIKVLSLLGSYKDGTYIHNKKFEKILTRHMGKRMSVTCERPAALNRDGECVVVNSVEMSIVPGAVRFILPQGIKYHSKCKDFIKSNSGT